jgi:sterol desaturase/sphingolipid hydroxylase (fatty acid hydroxylase superfamily)
MPTLQEELTSIEYENYGGLNLNNADFSSVELRAWFQRANFARVKSKRTSRQAIVSVLVALMVALLAANAIGSTLFGALGQTAEDPAWPYVLVLYMVLGIATVAAALRAITRPSWRK